MKVIVIGGGPAGMLAAISSASQNQQVLLLEKMDSLGKKLLITGKGRCNITSSLPMEDFIQNIPGNGMFLFSAFHQYTNQDILKLLQEEGLAVKEERGHRIFPITDNAKDVRNALLKKMQQLGVTIQTGAKVEKILQENGKVTGVEYMQQGTTKVEKAEKVILATGGKSYSATGSTGDGYEMAKKLGHSVTNLQASLVPLTASDTSIVVCKALQGLSLKNVTITIKDNQNNKTIYEDFGEMLFTHFGVSGPTILSASAHLIRYKNVKELLKQQKIQLLIDLKPALTEEKLDERILRDFAKEKNKAYKNSLEELLPKKLIEPMVQMSNIHPNKQVNSITKEERTSLVFLLKHFPITIEGFRPIEEAIITAGGVSTKEINPKTMESKLVKGLYFAGELIDVDAYTGGFNLQIAYSTGYVAGKNET